jgi:DNA-binding transcriptional MerR regulator
MEWWQRVRRNQLIRELRQLGYELDEVSEMLAEVRRREVSPQTPDPGTQQLGPLSP